MPDSNSLLSEAKRILNLRLDGFVASLIYDFKNNKHIPSNFDANITRNFIQDCIPHLANAFRESPLQNNEGPKWMVVEYSDHSMLAHVISPGIIAVVVAKDKLGDICFHCIWSRDPMLGIHNMLVTAAQAFTSGQLNNPTNRMMRNNFSLGRKFNQQQKNKILNEVSSRFSGLSKLGIFEISDSSWTFQNIMITTDQLFLEDIVNLIQLCCEVAERDQLTSGQLSTILIAYENSFVLLTKHNKTWELIEVRDEKESLGKLLYWGRSKLTTEVVRNIKENRKVNLLWKEESQILGTLDKTTNGLWGITILTLGNWQDKLPWSEPIKYSESEKVGEYMGLCDIATSLIELAENIDFIVCDQDRAPIGIESIILEYEEGCSNITILDSKLIAIIAARQHSSSISSKMVEVKKDLRKIFMTTNNSGTPIKWSNYSVTDLEKLNPQIRPKLAGILNTEKHIYISAFCSTEDVKIGKIQICEYHVLSYSANSAPHQTNLFDELDLFIYKVAVYTRFALGDAFGELKAITINSTSGYALELVKIPESSLPVLINPKKYTFFTIIHPDGEREARRVSDAVITSLSTETKSLQTTGKSFIGSGLALSLKELKIKGVGTRKSYKLSSQTKLLLKKPLELDSLTIFFEPTQQLLNNKEKLKVRLLIIKQNDEESIRDEHLELINSQEVHLNLKGISLHLDFDYEIMIDIRDSNNAVVSRSPKFPVRRGRGYWENFKDFYSGFPGQVGTIVVSIIILLLIPLLTTLFPQLKPYEEFIKIFVSTAILVCIVLAAVVWYKFKDKDN